MNHFFVAAFAGVVLNPALLACAQNTVTFDNQSGKIALVKLVGPTKAAVTVRAGAKQTVKAAAGVYSIKVQYGAPPNCHFSQGQEFEVKETPTATSATTITLQEIVGGNYGSHPISRAEFDQDAPTLKPGAAAPRKPQIVGTQKVKPTMPVIPTVPPRSPEVQATPASLLGKLTPKDAPYHLYLNNSLPPQRQSTFAAIELPKNLLESQRQQEFPNEKSFMPATREEFDRLVTWSGSAPFDLSVEEIQVCVLFGPRGGLSRKCSGSDLRIHILVNDDEVGLRSVPFEKRYIKESWVRLVTTWNVPAFSIKRGDTLSVGFASDRAADYAIQGFGQSHVEFREKRTSDKPEDIFSPSR